MLITVFFLYTISYAPELTFIQILFSEFTYCVCIACNFTKQMEILCFIKRYYRSFSAKLELHCFLFAFIC